MNSIKLLTTNLFIITFLFSGCNRIFSDEDTPELMIQPPTEANNIKVIEPVFGKILSPGDTLNIKWNAPTIRKIKIELYRKSEYRFTIANNLGNNGNFNWIIPFGTPFSNHYLIKVVSYNNENIYGLSGQFGIQ